MTHNSGTRTPRSAQPGQSQETTLSESPGTLSFHLKRAEQALIARKANAVRALDLTEPQCKVLGYLADGTAKSCTQLSREALVTSQTMTGIVKNLEAKGLVERHASPDHGRVMLVSLTGAGAERAAAAGDFSRSVEAGLRQAMTEDDYAQLLGLLDRVAEVAPELTLDA
ncbi:DNA-binding MarR family transcriptional regulator [Streptosporangium album]|uniref:DNA-binding MarR family transcriptional regulator n=1 Tax=Streptosporangium album TaxID=47479 RepID=A0A7W7WEZ7_9ACTN|nr:MarR family winged helix-turn-helix transcriptional regulator [Streptosporangium album]MBB4944398.1 DNA-binding MarR family transcriptional regulator [Streptosporangium album]